MNTNISRETTKLNDDLKAIEQDVSQTTSKFELRTKQFQLFLYSIHQLSQSLEDDLKDNSNNNNNKNASTKGTNASATNNNNNALEDGSGESTSLSDSKPSETTPPILSMDNVETIGEGIFMIRSVYFSVCVCVCICIYSISI